MIRKPVATALLALAAALLLPWMWTGASKAHPHHGSGADLGFRFHLHQPPARAVPQHVGQDALGAVQEVAGLLLADTATDWSEISITRLRRHLVELNLLMLHAEATESPVNGGLEIRATGEGATLDALRRMVPAHARQMDRFRGWRVAAEDRGEEVWLRITSDDPAEVAVVRGLGFFGFMATGVHHPHQLLAMARGRSAHWPDPLAGASSER